MTSSADAVPEPDPVPLAVVVLAAGQGTRMRSRRAKVLHEIAGRPMLAHVLDAADALAPDHLLVVVRHEREAVAAAVADAAPRAVLVDQDAVPGTGRAVEQALDALSARGGFAGDVLVLNGDLPLVDDTVLLPLLAAHRSGSRAVTVLSARLADPTGYGRIVRDDDGLLAAIVEHRDATAAELAIDEVNAGVYVFRARGLARRLADLGAGNDQGEHYLTDVIAALVADREVVAAVEAERPELVAGVNDRAQLADAARRMNAAIVRRWQLAGVTVMDPATTWIDAAVVLAEDVELRPNTHLARATAVDRDAVIGPDTTLTDCEVGAGARVTRTDGTLAVIGAGATVGPWAFLRPGTELGVDGKIGTFVETKNAVIGAGSKVPHLSYIGDTEVGTGSNVGAGTITANYDGVAKHRTTVGSHVRTGSHNVFVAPVSIGDGAYTGAGTVVRKDVPAGALGVNVAPQRNVEGWVRRRRPGSAAAAAAEQQQPAHDSDPAPRAAGSAPIWEESS